ncbi:MAG TPA: tetratricopeptide repeat protein, partial [Pyrinomonadaceae bacterium]|nr:tetratricopeptide repeat protein [Pyrinomonadaceae bacterium]
IGCANIKTSPDRSSMSEVTASFWKRVLLVATCFVLVSVCPNVSAQTVETFGDDAADPVRLFDRGQGAHARGELEKAIGFYEQALKVRPEFPEAEFQLGSALASLGRLPEAEGAFRRAITYKKNWSLPYSALGVVLVRQNRDKEAEQFFNQALTADNRDNVALRMLAELRLRAGDAKSALDFAKRATTTPEAPAPAWVALALAEKANGNNAGAKAALDRVLANEPENIAALLERADLYTDEKNFELAITDLKLAAKSKSTDKAVMSRLAYALQQAGKTEEAQAVAKSAGIETQQPTGGNGAAGVVGTPEEIEAANSTDPVIARKALEKLLEKNPRSAMLLGRLGASYRTDDPARSLEFFRKASELQPDAPEYALGYAAALVQARRFAEAVGILRQVVKASPDNYVARANLATALYESKRYADAIPEYEWILTAKPEIVVAHYFIATSHDYLGEYPEALVSYEKFLSVADPKTNQLEIDKVKLRLPTLRRQIQLGEGAKKKP